MGPEEAERGLTVQVTITVTVVAGAGKTECVKLHDIIVIVGTAIIFSPHIILNQSGIGTSTSRGWERQTDQKRQRLTYSDASPALLSLIISRLFFEVNNLMIFRDNTKFVDLFRFFELFFKFV